MMGARAASRRVAWALALSTTDAAWAHPGAPPAPHDLWESWNLSPTILLGLSLAAFLYWRGYVCLRRAGARSPGRNRAVVGRSQAVCFVWAMLALQVALVSPLDALGSSLLSAHMAQHLLLLVVAPPLFVLASPGYVMAWALPLHLRRQAASLWHGAAAQRTVRRLAAVAFTPLAAVALYTGVVWVWHAPPLYEAALTREWLHVLEHLTFLGTAYLFWWLLLAPLGRRRVHHGVAVAVLFLTSVQGSALGALMAFSPTAWYTHYAGTTPAWGVAHLADQQLAGLIMWMPVGTVYVLLACAFVWRWLRGHDLSEQLMAGGREAARASGGG